MIGLIYMGLVNLLAGRLQNGWNNNQQNLIKLSMEIILLKRNKTKCMTLTTNNIKNKDKK
jgi:hypothetical protein